MGWTTKLNWRFLNHQRYYWTVSFNCQFAFLTAHFMFGWGCFLLFRGCTVCNPLFAATFFFHQIGIFQYSTFPRPMSLKICNHTVILAFLVANAWVGGITNIKKETTWKKTLRWNVRRIFWEGPWIWSYLITNSIGSSQIHGIFH